MTTSFVLSGGGSLGAVQVGMLRALLRHDVAPDLVVGTSIGGLNAVALDSTLPVTVTATEVTTGRQVALSSRPPVPAPLATSAIPGVFEPVTIDGRALMDGGIADNTAIDLAVASGAEVVYVLPTGFSCDLPSPPPTALGMAVHALALLIERRLVEASHRTPDGVELHIVPPLCPLTVVPVDFSHSEELIDRAYTATEEWLATGRTAAPPGTRHPGEPGRDPRAGETSGAGDAGSPTMRPTG